MEGILCHLNEKRSYLSSNAPAKVAWFPIANLKRLETRGREVVQSKEASEVQDTCVSERNWRAMVPGNVGGNIGGFDVSIRQA